jgi:hypothetical protein
MLIVWTLDPLTQADHDISNDAGDACKTHKGVIPAPKTVPKSHP